MGGISDDMSRTSQQSFGCALKLQHTVEMPTRKLITDEHTARRIKQSEFRV